MHDPLRPPSFLMSSRAPADKRPTGVENRWPQRRTTRPITGFCNVMCWRGTRAELVCGRCREPLIHPMSQKGARDGP
jgi:hypothetical protein